MKKYLLILALVAFTFPVQAQEQSIFKPFKVDLALGIPGGKAIRPASIVIMVEPKYALMDQLAVGLRLQHALILNLPVTKEGKIKDANSKEPSPVTFKSSYLATGDYYFSNSAFRPFLGVGSGIYNLEIERYTFLPDGTFYATTIVKETKFGGLVRGGLEAGHFRVALEYNIMSQIDDHTQGSHLGIKVGGFLGGGRRFKKAF
ncbi:MAG: hypothetical protein WBP45_10740 [Daejeonella sp.]